MALRRLPRGLQAHLCHEGPRVLRELGKVVGGNDDAQRLGRLTAKNLKSFVYSTDAPPLCAQPTRQILSIFVPPGAPMGSPQVMA